MARVTTWKVSEFGVILVRIFLHSDWVLRDTEYLSEILVKVSIETWHPCPYKVKHSNISDIIWSLNLYRGSSLMNKSIKFHQFGQVTFWPCTLSSEQIYYVQISGKFTSKSLLEMTCPRRFFQQLAHTTIGVFNLIFFMIIQLTFSSLLVYMWTAFGLNFK